jgi:hypothetical protein
LAFAIEDYGGAAPTWLEEEFFNMVGNRVFAHALISCLAFVLVFAPWGSIHTDSARSSTARLTSRSVPEPIWIDPTWLEENWRKENWLDQSWIQQSWLGQVWLKQSWLGRGWLEAKSAKSNPSARVAPSVSSAAPASSTASVRAAVAKDRPHVSAHEQTETPQTAQDTLVFGWQGSIALGKVYIAYWALCVCLMIGAVASALNFLTWTRVPSVLIFAAFGMTAASALVATVQHAFVGAVGTGSVLAIACALFGLLLSPSDEVREVTEVDAAEQPGRQPSRHSRRQLRSAA